MEALYKTVPTIPIRPEAQITDGGAVLCIRMLSLDVKLHKSNAPWLSSTHPCSFLHLSCRTWVIGRDPSWQMGWTWPCRRQGARGYRYRGSTVAVKLSCISTS